MKTYQPNNRPRAHDMRQHSTRSEIRLWMQLRASALGWPFKRQVPIGHYIVDFYCPPLALVVEVDGAVHQGEQAQQYDDRRTNYLEREHHLHILRLSARDCEGNMENALRLLEEKIDELATRSSHPAQPSPSARGCP